MKQHIRVLVLLGLAGFGGHAPADAPRRTPVVEAVQQALPCVVNVGTERRVTIQYQEPQRQERGRLFDRLIERYLGNPAPTGTASRVQQSLGSGVVIHPKGYILTNFHVTERASRITITFADGRSFEARFVAGDEASDVALLKIEVSELLPWLEFASDDDYLLGETMIAVGNPFGLGQTVTAGILSARNREAKYEGQVLFHDILQTDAAINPGSSGGPLLNVEARIVGLTVAMYEEGQNIGFAVPSVRVKELLAGWMSPWLLDNVLLGFTVVARPEGLVVTDVEAAQNPLQPGDRIEAVNGTAVNSLFGFYRALLPLKTNDRLHLLVWRDGQPLSVETAVAGLSAVEGARLAREKLGVQFALRNAAGEPHVPVTGEGLLISEVEPESPAGRAGLKAGEVIARINGTDVNSLEDLAAILGEVKPGDDVALEVVSLEEVPAGISARSAVKTIKAL